MKYPSTVYRAAVKAIIRDRAGNILVVKETPDKHWDLPGGGLEHGESLHECLGRELIEELGVRLDVDESIIPAFRTFYASNRDIWLLWIVYDLTTSDILAQVKIDPKYCKFINKDGLDPSHSVELEIIKLL